MRFSPDSRRLITGDEFGNVKLCTIGKEKPLYELEAHDGIVSSVGFSPDGTKVFSGGEGGGVKIWETMEGSRLGEYKFCGRILAHHFAGRSDPLLVASARQGADHPEIHKLE